MTSSVEILKHNNVLNSHAFDYLNEMNTDFLVYGIIGTPLSGKSSILNVRSIKNLYN